VTRWRFLLGAWFLVLALASGLAPHWLGRPPGQELPSFALDSVWILYFERAFLLFFGSVFVTSIVLRAFSGTLPTRLSLQGDTEWEIDETRAVVSQGSVATQDAIERLRSSLDDERDARRHEARVAEVALEELESELRAHEVRLERLESRRRRWLWRAERPSALN
jgi:hypothetical protein